VTAQKEIKRDTDQKPKRGEQQNILNPNIKEQIKMETEDRA
jgi:hypothetical protein